MKLSRIFLAVLLGCALASGVHAEESLSDNELNLTFEMADPLLVIDLGVIQFIPVMQEPILWESVQLEPFHFTAPMITYSCSSSSSSSCVMSWSSCVDFNAQGSPVVPAPVPVPGALGVMACGLLALAGMGRRQEDGWD